MNKGREATFSWIQHRQEWFWKAGLVYSLPSETARRSSSELTTHGSYSPTCTTSDSCPELLLVLLTWTTEINQTAIRKIYNCQQQSRCDALQIPPFLELGTKATTDGEGGFCNGSLQTLWALVRSSRQGQKHPHSHLIVHSNPPSIPCEKPMVFQ